MDVAPKILYMREHSNVIRKWTSSTKNLMQENPIFQIDRISRIMIVAICRIKQRLLKQAWQTWIERTGVFHDYTRDLRTILYRQLPNNELRTELEIEVLYKWVMQVKDIDPTGIASTIYECKKKSAIYTALQQLRLEFYAPGEAILFQGDAPRVEDGHFTVVRGSCEVLQFTGDSVRLTKLLHYAKKKKWDEARKLLETAQVVAHIPELSGFGELSTLTGVHRAATIQTSKIDEVTEILVLPKYPLLDLLKYRGSSNASTQSEAIDFLRQSGLANRISPKDLVLAASTMSKKTLQEGEILFYKGEEVKCIYMVVAGEFLLDTSDYIVNGIPLPFANASPDTCYHLSTGSILGDEGVLGDNKVFESTAAVVSSMAVVFQAEGFAMNFIAEKMGCLRYSALYYRDRLCWESENQIAEQINPYTFFHSLRKSIAYTKPFRGTTKRLPENIEPLAPVIATIKQRRAAKRNAATKKSAFGFAELGQITSRPNSSQMKNNLAEDSKSSIGSSILPRNLRGIGLHRAQEVNKIVKKHLQNSIKLHAKENILYEELRKKIAEEGEGDDDTEKEQNKNVFSKSLRDYYDRSAEVTRKLAEAEEQAKQQNTTAKAAVRFFSLVNEDESSVGTDPSMVGVGLSQEVLPGSLENTLSLELSKKSKNSKESNRHNIHLTPTSSIDGTPRSLSVQSVLADPAGPTKMEKYFDWMDSLKKQHYRALTHQSQLTVDINQNIDIDAKLGLGVIENEENVDWKEIGEIMHTYSLTPMIDSGVPWFLAPTKARPSSPHNQTPPGSSGAPRSPNHRAQSSKKSAESPRKKTRITFSEEPQVRVISAPTKSRPGSFIQPQPSSGRTQSPDSSTPKASMNRKNSFVAGINRTASTESTSPKSTTGVTVDTATETLDSNGQPKKSAMKNRRGGIVSGSFGNNDRTKISEEDERIEGLKTKARLEHDYKGYTASNSRDDYVQQRMIEMQQMMDSFHRAKNPENRRTLGLHIKIHNLEENQDLSKKEKVEETTTKDSTLQRAVDNKELNKMATTMMLEEKEEKYMQELQAHLKEFIESPEMFIQKLEATSLNVTKRNLNPGNEWHTRYFITQENAKRKPPSVLEAVRTHLRENLEYYSKDNLIQVYENLKKQNYEQAMKAILGKKNLPSDKNYESTTYGSSNPSQNNSDSKRMPPPLTRENSDASSAFPSLSRSASMADNTAFGVFLSPEGAGSRRPSLKDDSDQLPANLLSTILEGPTETVSAPNSAVLLTPMKEETKAKTPRAAATDRRSPSLDQGEPPNDLATRSRDLQSRGMMAVKGEETFQRPPDIVIAKEEDNTNNDNEPQGKQQEINNASNNDKKRSVSPKKSHAPSPAATPKKGKLSNANTPTKGSKDGDGKYNSTIASSNDSMSTNLALATTSGGTPATGSNNAKNAAGVAGTTLAVGMVMQQPPKKISDIKAPSKALQQFEEFLAQQQVPSKAASEGRKKANRTSRFRLPMMIANEERRLNNIHELINISEIQKDRLKMELTLFQALNPHYTPKDKEIFVKTFKQLNPNVSVENIQHEIDHILSDLDYEIGGQGMLMMKGGAPITPGKSDPQLLLPNLGSSRSPSPKSPSRGGTGAGGNAVAGKGPGATNLQIAAGGGSPGNATTSSFFSSEGDGNPSPYSTTMEHTQWDETQQLTKWQEYTIQDIITTKDGERKTLPLITLPKSAKIPGRKFVQRGGHGVLITMSAKKDEEPIDGPTSYLELYKSSFRVRISSKKREKVIRELKSKLPQM